MGKLAALFTNVAFVILLSNFVESKLLTAPFQQESCPVEDRYIQADTTWNNDDDRTIVSGTLSILKELDEPIKIECQVDKKSRGMWQYFVYQSFQNVCDNIYDETKPYAFLIQKFGESDFLCPMQPISKDFDDAEFERDLSPYVNFTSEDVGTYRANIKAYTEFNKQTILVGCLNIFFDITEVEDDDEE